MTTRLVSTLCIPYPLVLSTTFCYNYQHIIDIDPGEAEKLIELIELLMEEWYINREKRNKLFGDIMQITADKKAIKHREG